MTPKELVFGLKRNQIFDLISILKDAIKDYDNINLKGRYICRPLLVNDEYRVSFAIDRQSDPLHPFYKKPHLNEETIKQRSNSNGKDKNK